MSSTDKENLVAFAGIAGANGDMACRRAHPYMDTLPVPTFEAAFEAVEKGEAKYALIPIENSQAGRVAEIHNILPETPLHIIGEYFHPVRHQLCGVKGAKLEEVKDVYSHPQALMQCRKYLESIGAQAHGYADTAMAGEAVAEWKDNSKAALCSDLAATLYGLDILDGDVQDADDNKTLFVTFSREPIDPEIGKDKVLTSVLFTLRNIPAALYKALGGFATNGVNMLKLESYIVGGSQQAQFFMTFEGHPAERPVQLALEELGFFTQRVNVLGVYYADPARA